MANLKKELKAVISRFDAAQEAFTEGATLQKKNKKKLKAAKAKIKSLEQKVASLEQQLDVVKDDQAALAEINSTTGTVTTPKKSSSKKTSPKRTRRKSTKEDSATQVSAEEMAEAVSEAPESVSEAAAETPAPKPRRGRPRKTTGAAKSARKSGTRSSKAAAKTKSATKTGTASKGKTTARRGRPSTKGPESELTKIHGVGATMAKRFEEAGVSSVEQFANLSDDEMSAVLQQCGPRYRNADSEKMEGYRDAARTAMA